MGRTLTYCGLVSCYGGALVLISRRPRSLRIQQRARTFCRRRAARRRSQLLGSSLSMAAQMLLLDRPSMSMAATYAASWHQRLSLSGLGGQLLAATWQPGLPSRLMFRKGWGMAHTGMY